MKKVILILTLSLLAVGAFSQVKFGLKAGVNYTFPSYSVKADSIGKPSTSGIGSAFGVFLDLPLTDNLFFQVEALASFRYYNSVVKTSTNENNFSSTTEVLGYHKLIYAEIPLMFKYNINLNTGKYGRSNVIGVYAGPVLGIQVGKGYIGETVTSVTVLSQNTVTKSELSQTDIDYKPFDLAIGAGAMYDFEKGLRIGLRFIRSLAAVNNNNGYSINHNLLQLSLGYVIFNDRAIR